MVDPVSAEIVTVAAKAAITRIVGPALIKAFEGMQAVSGVVVDVFINRFSDYIKSQVERHAYLNTIVFGNQCRLDQLYQPLTVVPALPIHGEAEPKGILID